MSILQVFLFGGVRIVQNSEINLGPIAEALLAYLLIYRDRRHRRDVLASLFWGEQTDKQARRCLNTTLWRLRNKINLVDELYIPSSANGEIHFNLQADYWLDIALFHEKTQIGFQQPIENMRKVHVEALEEATCLYKGDLLEGYYQDWALRERERQRSVYLQCLLKLTHYYQYFEDYEKSVLYGQKILELEPLREEIHRELMSCYLAIGQRDKARQQFQICKKLLASELDVFPMEETQALYRTVLSAPPSLPKSSLTTLEQSPVNFSQAVYQLQLAEREFNNAHIKLQEAIQNVAYFSKHLSDPNSLPPPDFKANSENLLA